MTTRREIKQTAQGNLIAAMQYAFEESGIDLATRAEMSCQMERVEKLFGYVPRSWSRGV